GEEGGARLDIGGAGVGIHAGEGDGGGAVGDDPRTGDVFGDGAEGNVVRLQVVGISREAGGKGGIAAGKVDRTEHQADEGIGDSRGPGSYDLVITHEEIPENGGAAGGGPAQHIHKDDPRAGDLKIIADVGGGGRPR